MSIKKMSVMMAGNVKRFGIWVFMLLRLLRKKFSIIGRKKILTRMKRRMIFSRFVTSSVIIDGAVKYL